MREGDIAYYHRYVRNTEDSVPDQARLQDVKRGVPLIINGKDLVDSLVSAHDYTSTKKITRTQLAEKLIHSYPLPFTVAFRKANGEERTLVGHLLSSEHLLGRSQVYEFREDKAASIRQVDHRTLTSLILDGTKYEVKK